MGHDRRPRSPGAKFLEISGACSRRVNLAPVLWREPNLALVGAGPTADDPAELVADQGYHSRDGLKDLEDGVWKSRIAEKKVRSVNRWHGDEEARRAVYNNRARLRSGVAKEAFKLRAELCERGFALVLDRGGLRRAWLRGRENLRKRYLVHVAGYKDRKSTRLNSSHANISYAVFCLKKKNKTYAAH